MVDMVAHWRAALGRNQSELCNLHDHRVELGQQMAHQFLDTGQLSLKCAQEHGFVLGYQFGDPQLQIDTMAMGR